MFLAGYYGLLRAGELTQSDHVLKVDAVNIGVNKEKLLFILTSSKTHCKGNEPQQIKISSLNRGDEGTKFGKYCPFTAINDYIEMRPDMKTADKQFFVFSDNSPVKSHHFREILKQMITINNLDSSLYTIHSLRSGRAGDLLSMGVSVETIKKIGRWRSNAVFLYLKN